MWFDVAIGMLAAAVVLLVFYRIYRGLKVLGNADWRSFFKALTGL